MGAVGNQRRCVSVYFYLCTVDVCQNPPEHQICEYLRPRVRVCSVYSLWEDAMSCLCSEICLKVCLYSGLQANRFSQKAKLMAA